MKHNPSSPKGKTVQQKEYAIYSGLLYPTCLRILSNQFEAEEAMHDSLLHYFAFQGTFESEVQKRSWLFKVAASKSIDRLRKREPEFATEGNIYGKTEPQWEQEDAIQETDPFFEQGQTDSEVAKKVARIKKELTALAPGYRTVLSLFLFEGYDFEEIASILSLTPSTVRSQYVRARAKLRSLLSNPLIPNS